MAGLFDSFAFNPSEDGIQGLLARIAPSALTQLGQSQGFAPGQQQDPNAPTSTMAVGNYQMPVFGQAAAAPATGSATDFSAQSRPPQQAAEQQQLPPALGGGLNGNFLGNLSSGFQSIGNGGSILGALTGNYTDPINIQRQNLKSQYDSLIPILGQQKALLAVMNPEAGKTLLTEALTNKTEVKMVKDGFGQEHPYAWNPITQEFKPLTPGASSGGDAQGLTDKISGMAQSGASRQELLQTVPSEYRGHVEAVLDGRALPSNIGRGPARAAIMAAAHAIDPNFDESNIPLRFKTAGDYAPNGQSGRSIVALNTVQHHIGKLSDDLENVGDTGWTWLNALRNGIAVNTSMDPKQGKAVQAIQDDIKAVTDEMSAAYKAGRVSDHEIEAWNKLANSNLPLRQLKQGIYDFVGLLNGKRDQLNETHQAILGRDAPGINRDLNDAITKKVTTRNSVDTVPTQSASSSVPNGAIDALRNNPSLATQFDAKYGAGASSKILGR